MTIDTWVILGAGYLLGWFITGVACTVTDPKNAGKLVIMALVVWPFLLGIMLGDSAKKPWT